VIVARASREQGPHVPERASDRVSDFGPSLDTAAIETLQGAHMYRSAISPDSKFVLK
jgi:hypothetical protein